ncbi:hypothetical protein KA531_00190 [Candidatus Saccharibacteria bacterium]|nr:hypothetical protein [Candidatus Saccharibacteria bacterium]
MNNQENSFWFKRKRYGYGWVPATKQGWIIIISYISIVILGGISIEDQSDNQLTAEVLTYLLLVFLATILVIAISYKKGPRPKWRWGKASTDNSSQDW